MSEPRYPNVGVSLVCIHRCLTRAIHVLLENSQSFGQTGFPDPRIQAGFVDYLASFITVLHAHHSLEDELAFPYFRSLIPGAPFDVLSGEHKIVGEKLDEMRRCLSQISEGSPVEQPLSQLNQVLAQLDQLWHPHIHIEEAYLTPQAVSSLLEPEESDRLTLKVGEYNQRELKPDYLTLPFTLYNLEPVDRAVLAEVVPPVVTQQLIPVVWKDKWQAMEPFLLN